MIVACLRSRLSRAWLVTVALSCVSLVLPANAGEDLNQVFQMGKAAYYKGDMELAQQLLSQVAARDPRHFETKALLAQIRVSLKTEGSSLKKRYQGVMLTKVEFADVTLQEALEGLRVLAKNASNGQVIPNFIVKDEGLNAKSFSLSLHNIPLTEVIQYVAGVAGGRAVYDKHAVLFTTASSAGS